MTATSSKRGNRYAVLLPEKLLEQTELMAGGETILSFNGRECIIEKLEETRSARLARRFEGFQGNVKCTEIGLGPDQGKEIVE